METIRGEIGSRVADGATTAAQLTRYQAMLNALKDEKVQAVRSNIDGCQTAGSLSYLLALASHIVNDDRSTYSVGTAEEPASMSGATRGSAKLKIVLVKSFASFAELMHVWQALAHALGVSNILETTQFLQKVVFDGMSQLKLTWQESYCLLLVYIEAVEGSPALLNLGNVFEAGSQDTRVSAARARAKLTFKTRDTVDEVKKTWNGRDTPNAKSTCHTYNFGKTSHDPKHLREDGTCKHRHVCNHWVTGKGKNGICEGPHARIDCTNPGKCDKPADA